MSLGGREKLGRGDCFVVAKIEVREQRRSINNAGDEIFGELEEQVT